MLNFAMAHKLGNLIKVLIGFVPLASAAGTRTGANGTTSIDRSVAGGKMYSTLHLVQVTGVTTGGPATQTVDCKIQDSADGTTGWADYIPPGQATVAAIPQITAASTLSEVDVDLAGARRFLRVVETVAFTGGGGPTIETGSLVILSGSDRIPA